MSPSLCSLPGMGWLLATCFVVGSSSSFSQSPESSPALLSSNEATQFAEHGELLEEVAFSPDGSKIASAGWSGSKYAVARVWDSSTGALISTMTHEALASGIPPAHIWDVSFSPEGDRIVTGAEDGAARIWDVSSGDLLQVLELNQGAGSYTVNFNPEGNLLLASGDRFHRLWDLRNQPEPTAIQFEGRSPSAFSPDGASFATYGSRTVLRDGEEVREHVVTLRSTVGGEIAGEVVIDQFSKDLSYSPDGRRLVTAGYDGTGGIWDVGTGARIAELAGHEMTMMTARFSPDGTRIVTTSLDKSLRLWDAETGREIATFPKFELHEGRVVGQTRAAVFSPDGERILLGLSQYVYLIAAP